MRNALIVVLVLVTGEVLGAEAPPTHRVDSADDKVEEVVVIGEPVERGKPPEFEFLMHVYDSRREGMKLYRDGRYEEAFPLLLQAAKRGFKLAQVRVAYLYASGIGTNRDVRAAIGFLGVAAKPPTHPQILNRYKHVWKQIPAELKPPLQRIIDRFDSLYGSRANRVACDRSHRTGTYMRSLRCNFMDECGMYRHLRAWVPELRDCPGGG
ncbi:MAG: hypothetical protein OXH68_06645 [Gammaproteobacteria bacterium]|nr:hypothetical protein [Gammaproteobacteria bacterium]